MELRVCCLHPGALLCPDSLLWAPSLRFFHLMAVHECQYHNGTERVRLLGRFIYNRQQLVHYDSNVGRFVADTELGKPAADNWNSRPEVLENAQAQVD
uniref:MHC class II beta chain N-terminal domain-containing protein n=1 Tax=Anas platyrhynchos platyrhynchos TaxID=8840 RepID=U3I327_ANAPP